MGKRQGGARRSKHRASRYWGLGALVVLAVAGAVLAWRAQAPPTHVAASGSGRSPGNVVPALARRETRPTLDPALFVGKAALAHRVAREIPDTLDQLYCYCECDKHMGHKSLLSCYTDGHAAT
jgi:hypothetical protein